ncbi:MAG TPA: HNH endonuclease signature motif containing protein [Dehalococcoidia bacterium]|nr:HNH endonuclease signature motif containing protein [Dehalococcoidia bacterium]
MLTALWRQESDLLAGDFYETRLTQSQREDVFRAKGGRCVECGAVATDIDHILGIGGGDDLDNLQPLCRDCHLRKTALEGGMYVSPDLSQSAESREWLRAMLPRRVWTRANASGIPLFAVNDEPEARRYAAYLCRVYATRPRLCDDEQRWPQVWQQIKSQRRSEIP